MTIDTLDVNMQAKLLRVIQEKEFERLGSTKVIKLDVRFWPRSNKDLTQLIQAGAFREAIFTIASMSSRNSISRLSGRGKKIFPS